LAMVQGVHPGPANEISAVFGSKPMPLTVKVNDWPATGGFGAVVTLLTCGAGPPVDAATVSVRPFDAVAPEPFCTVTV